jgi:glycosyltransferase involved in cell wall biosynthesis
MKLSILICSVPNRSEDLKKLYDHLQSQIGDSKEIEILSIMDNKSMSIGTKRNLLLNCARGNYLAFLDDDDWVSSDYIKEILLAIESKSDVITFNQHCTVNGKEFTVNFGLNNPNEPASIDQAGNYRNIRRKPYHMCIWKGVIAKNTPFKEISYGEDIDWIMRLCQRCKTETHIDKQLHFYRYSDSTSESIQHRGS